MRYRKLPTVDRLAALFHYDQTTGIVTRAIDGTGGVKAGDPVGSMHKDGYLVTAVSRVQYKLHRLIWKMQTGCDPVEMVDHVNGNRADNRWENLREASHSQNKRNSPTKGASYVTRTGRWKSEISTDRGRVFLGYFDSEQEACAAYAEAASKFHGEFAKAA